MRLGTCTPSEIKTILKDTAARIYLRKEDLVAGVEKLEAEVEALRGERIKLKDMESWPRLKAEIRELRQKVADAEWMRDEHAEAVHMNFADPPDPLRGAPLSEPDWRWQVYDCDGDLIGDAMVNDYWKAIRAAREVSDGESD